MTDPGMVPSSEILAVGVAGTVTIIGAIVAAVTSIITTIRTKKAVEGVAATNVAQDRKLDNITILVDGRYSEVLQQLADMKLLFAAQTGRQVDRDKATEAQGNADAQAGRVSEAKAASGVDVQPPECFR